MESDPIDFDPIDFTYTQKDLITDARNGALGGYLGYRTGDFTAKYFATPIIRSQPILFQNYNNLFPNLMGNTVGSSVSGATPVVIDYLNQDKKK